MSIIAYSITQNLTRSFDVTGERSPDTSVRNNGQNPFIHKNYIRLGHDLYFLIPLSL